MACPAHLMPLCGRYRSANDACTRRVFWYEAAKELYMARTRPDGPEEPAYPADLPTLRRLLSYRLLLPA